MSTLKLKTTIPLSKFFARGESLVATTGMAFIAILAFAIGGVVWVSARTIDDSIVAQSDERVRETSALIASQAELRLNNQDIPGLRRLMLDSVASGMVEACEVNIVGVGVVASSDASTSTLPSVPASWKGGQGVLASLSHDDQSQRTIVFEPLVMNGLQGVTLKVVITRSQSVVGSDSIRASSVGIASVGLILMLLVYRRFRNRLGALSGIGDALGAVAQGERRVACLLVGEHLGNEAKAWNMLLEERDELEKQSVSREVFEASFGTVSESIGLPAACNTLTQGVMLIDQDLHVVYANGASCVFFRTSRENLSHASLEVIPDSEQVIDAVRGLFESKSSARVSFEIGSVEEIETNGAVLHVVVTRVDQEEVPQVLVFIEDVTQQRLADQSQNAFIAQATHELRTPLTTIRLYAEEAVDAGESDEQIREQALNVICSETRRLERIVGDMLCVSEIEAGSLSIHVGDVRTEQLFAEIQEDYKVQSKAKSVEMVFSLPPKWPAIRADRDRLGQAIHNLVGNAIKYTSSGGSVEVQASFDENDSMTVRVIDSGIGIDESQHSRIFERFTRAEDDRIAKVTGSGLGLALARQIARLHGGDITVESAVDKGSTFTLTLPGTQEIAKAA